MVKVESKIINGERHFDIRLSGDDKVDLALEAGFAAASLYGFFEQVLLEFDYSQEEIAVIFDDMKVKADATAVTQESFIPNMPAPGFLS